MPMDRSTIARSRLSAGLITLTGGARRGSVLSPDSADASVAATYHAIREKHVPRYLAQFQYRFNRRYRLGDMIPLWHGWRCAPRQCRTGSSSWLRFVGNQDGSYRRRPDQPCPKCGMPCGSAVSCPVQACPSKEAPKPNIQCNKACPVGGVEGGTPVAGSIRGAPPPTMIPVSPAPMRR
jgi:hypothetical protein